MFERSSKSRGVLLAWTLLEDRFRFCPIRICGLSSSISEDPMLKSRRVALMVVSAAVGLDEDLPSWLRRRLGAGVALMVVSAVGLDDLQSCLRRSGALVLASKSGHESVRLRIGVRFMREKASEGQSGDADRRVEMERVGYGVSCGSNGLSGWGYARRERCPRRHGSFRRERHSGGSLCSMTRGAR